MIVKTEAEMKKKWCPHARVRDIMPSDFNQDFEPVSVNRMNPKPLTNCLGSACAMFRRRMLASELYYYCGLAGDPQR